MKMLNDAVIKRRNLSHLRTTMGLMMMQYSGGVELARRTSSSREGPVWMSHCRRVPHQRVRE